MRHNARESDDIANITYVSFQNHLLLSLSWKESYSWHQEDIFISAWLPRCKLKIKSVSEGPDEDLSIIM